MTDAGAAGRAAAAPYYVVFDVDVRDALRYGECEGDWSPYRLVLLEFPRGRPSRASTTAPRIRTSTRCAMRSAMRAWSASKGFP
jgi:hypothetical protein